MKKSILYVVLATLLLLTTVTAGTTVSAESILDLKKQINQHEDKKSTLSKEKEELNSDKKDTESKIDKNLNNQKSVENQIMEIEAELSKTQNEITSKEDEIKKTNDEIDKLNNRIKDLEEEIEILEEKIAQRDLLLKDRLRSIQLNGEVNYFEVIFGAKDFADFISRTTAVNTIMDQDKSIMEEQARDKQLLEDNKKELVDKKEEVEDEKKELENQKDQLVALKNQLDGQKKERNKLLAKLEEEHKELEEIKLTIQEEQEILAAEEAAQAQAIALAQNKIGQIEQQAREEAERKRKEAEQAKQKVASAPDTKVKSSSPTPSSGGSGVFTLPANGPITSSYGMRVHPIFKTPRLHAGIDVGVGTGTALVAPADGVVSTARWMGGFGNVIMISHYINGKNYTTVSAHLSSIRVSPGQSVSRGQVIGATGNTGNSTGPHLHFEVHVGGYGNPVNPMPYLR